MFRILTRKLTVRIRRERVRLLCRSELTESEQQKVLLLDPVELALFFEEEAARNADKIASEILMRPPAHEVPAAIFLPSQVVEETREGSFMTQRSGDLG